MSLSFLSKIFILFFINSKPLEEETHPLLPKTSNLIVFLAWSSLKTYCLWKVYVLKSSNLHCNLFSYIGLLQQQVGKERWKKRNSWMFFCFGAFGSFESWGLHANIGMVCKVQFFFFFFSVFAASKKSAVLRLFFILWNKP